MGGLGGCGYSRRKRMESIVPPQGYGWYGWYGCVRRREKGRVSRWWRLEKKWCVTYARDWRIWIVSSYSSCGEIHVSCVHCGMFILSSVECRMSSVECRMSNVECRVSRAQCSTVCNSNMFEEEIRDPRYIYFIREGWGMMGGGGACENTEFLSEECHHVPWLICSWVVFPKQENCSRLDRILIETFRIIIYRFYRKTVSTGIGGMSLKTLRRHLFGEAFLTYVASRASYQHTSYPSYTQKTRNTCNTFCFLETQTEIEIFVWFYSLDIQTLFITLFWYGTFSLPMRSLRFVFATVFNVCVRGCVCAGLCSGVCAKYETCITKRPNKEFIVVLFPPCFKHKVYTDTYSQRSTPIDSSRLIRSSDIGPLPVCCSIL